MNATATKKPQRTVGVVKGTTFFVLTIHEGKRQWRYRVEELQASFGRAFSVARRDLDPVSGDHVDGEQYTVQVGGGAYNRNSCDCKGNYFAGHCKHCEAIVALIKLGKI